MNLGLAVKVKFVNETRTFAEKIQISLEEITTCLLVEGLKLELVCQTDVSGCGCNLRNQRLHHGLFSKS